MTSTAAASAESVFTYGAPQLKFGPSGRRKSASISASTAYAAPWSSPTPG